MNRDKALAQWQSVKTVKGEDSRKLDLTALLGMQAVALDKKKKATKKETERAKKALVTEIQKDIALEKKKATLTTKRAKLTSDENKATEKDLNAEEVQQAQDAKDFEKKQTTKRKSQSQAALISKALSKREAANDKAFAEATLRVQKEQTQRSDKKKPIPKLWMGVMRKYDSFAEDLRSALVNPETVGIEDVIQFRSTLKGLYSDAQKYKSLANVDSNAFTFKLDWHKKRIGDLENIVVAQAKLDHDNNVEEKRHIEQAKSDLDDAKAMLELYKRTGDVKKIAKAQEEVNDAERGVSALTKSKFGKLVDRTREDDVISIRKGVALALSWVGDGVKERTGRVLGGIGAAGKGAYAKAIGGLLNAAGDNPTMVKAVKGLDKTIRIGTTAVKALGHEAYKWIGKKLGALTSVVSGFLRNPLQSVGGFGGLIGLAALATTIIGPALEGIDKQLKAQYGEHYIRDFVDGLWSKGWDMLVRKIKDILGIKESKPPAKVMESKEAADVRLSRAQAAFAADPSEANKAELEEAQRSVNVTPRAETAANKGARVAEQETARSNLETASKQGTSDDINTVIKAKLELYDKMTSGPRKAASFTNIQNQIKDAPPKSISPENSALLTSRKFVVPAEQVGAASSASTPAAAAGKAPVSTPVGPVSGGAPPASAASPAPSAASTAGSVPQTASTPAATPAATPVTASASPAPAPAATPVTAKATPAAAPAAAASPVTATPKGTAATPAPAQSAPQASNAGGGSGSVSVAQVPTTMGSDGWIIHNGVGLVGT